MFILKAHNLVPVTSISLFPTTKFGAVTSISLFSTTVYQTFKLLTENQRLVAKFKGIATTSVLKKKTYSLQHDEIQWKKGSGVSHKSKEKMMTAKRDYFQEIFRIFIKYFPDPFMRPSWLGN